MPKLASTEVATWARALKARAQADYDERNTLILGIRRQRFMRARVSPPQTYQRFLGEGVKVPISLRLVQTVVGAVAGEKRPLWHINSPDPELASRARRWLTLILQMMESEVQPGLYWKFWDALAGDGTTVMKTTRRPWTEYPKRLSTETAVEFNHRVTHFFTSLPPLPFRTRVIDPMTFYPPRTEWGSDVCMERSLRPTFKVMQALGLQEGSDGHLRPIDTKLRPAAGADEPIPFDMTGLSSSMSPTIEVTEIWSKDGLLVDIGGQVWEYANDLNRIPFIWAHASSVAFNDPTLQSMSAAFPLLYLEPWINQTLSTLVGFAQLQATPTPTTHQPDAPGGVSTEPTIVDFRAGMLHEFAGNVVPGVWPIGQPKESIDILNTLVSLAERFTISPIPSFAGSRTPGTAFAQVQERVMSILRPMVDQAQVAWRAQGKFWLEAVRDVVKAPVFVSGLTFEEKTRRGRATETAISPKDIRKIADVQSEIRFRTPTDRISWDTHNVMMEQSGIWSKERARLESDVDDPEAEERQVTIERLLQSPAVQLLIQQRGLQDQPPLAALNQILGDELGGAGGGPDEPSGRPPGATEGVPRAPGGTRSATAPKGRLR